MGHRAAVPLIFITVGLQIPLECMCAPLNFIFLYIANLTRPETRQIGWALTFKLRASANEQKARRPIICCSTVRAHSPDTHPF